MKTRAIMFTVLCSMLLSSCWWNKDETPTVMVDDGRVVPVFSADNNASLTFVSPNDGSVDVSGHMPITFSGMRRFLPCKILRRHRPFFMNTLP